MKRARDYIVDQRGIDGSRLTIVNGGFRESDNVELWVVPSGATPPRATPTVQAGEVKPRKALRLSPDHRLHGQCDLWSLSSSLMLFYYSSRLHQTRHHRFTRQAARICIPFF